MWICNNEILFAAGWETFPRVAKNQRRPVLLLGHFPWKKGKLSMCVCARKRPSVHRGETLSSESPLFSACLCDTYTEAHSPTTGSERVELKEGFFWNAHASFYTSIPFSRGRRTDGRARGTRVAWIPEPRMQRWNKKKKKRKIYIYIYI